MDERGDEIGQIFMKKGILFDFDGVLAETMEDFYQAWKAVFIESGYFIKQEEFYMLEGMRVTDVAAKFCQKGGIPNNKIEIILAKKEAYYAKNHSFKFYPGVEDFISNLKKVGVPLGIVTAGTKDRLTKTVPLDFLSNFNAIVSNETGGRGKPFPDPYLRGASDLSLSPKECIVIENAPSGISAAKSGGAYCIAICSTLPRKYLEEADEIINNFSELIKLKSIIALQKTFLL